MSPEVADRVTIRPVATEALGLVVYLLVLRRSRLLARNATTLAS